jgi:hypothetical protein
MTLNDIAKDELNELLVGSFIASGEFREVYNWIPDSSLVLKVEKFGKKKYCNIHEYSIWEELSISNNPLRKWFAPCTWISNSGVLMLQKKTKPILEIPKKTPNVLADNKISNWGEYNGRMVIHDYGNHNFFRVAKNNFKMVETK